MLLCWIALLGLAKQRLGIMRLGYKNYEVTQGKKCCAPVAISRGTGVNDVTSLLFIVVDLPADLHCEPTSDCPVHQNNSSRIPQIRSDT
jgi:hypothetical protein